MRFNSFKLSHELWVILFYDFFVLQRRFASHGI